jgi:hypothetical protein
MLRRSRGDIRLGPFRWLIASASGRLRRPPAAASLELSAQIVEVNRPDAIFAAEPDCNAGGCVGSSQWGLATRGLHQLETLETILQ